MNKKYSIEQFKHSFAEYATGVALVATGNIESKNNLDSKSKVIKYGLIINSLASLSLMPTLTSWNLGKGNYYLNELLTMQTYVIHLLSSKHIKVANVFSSKSSVEERQNLLMSWPQDKNGSPILKDSRMTLFCNQLDVIEQGDHYIMVGKVTKTSQPEKNDVPLLYYRGKYGKFSEI